MNPIGWTNIDTSVGDNPSPSFNDLQKKIVELRDRISDLEGNNEYLHSQVEYFNIERIKFETEIRVLRDLLKGKF